MSDLVVVEETPRTAAETLDRLAQIIERGRLVQGTYSRPAGVEREPDAPCGGNNACMIGATWLAYGASQHLAMSTTGRWVETYIEGTGGDRRDYVRDRPELRAALGALNTAAEEKVNELRDPSRWSGGLGIYPSDDLIESLFESVWAQCLSDADLHREMAAVVERAKELLA